MKNTLFITHPTKRLFVPQGERPSFYNDRKHPLVPKNGILNVKKNFTVQKALKKATVTSTALGVYRLFVNGMRVGTTTENGMVYDELKPGWTDYRYRVLSYEYEITAMLQGSNVILAEVANGWWSGRISYGTTGYQNVAFAAEITMEYEDGTVDILQTDTSWDAMVGGPTRYADIWDGQYYDATYPHPAQFPDAYSWDNASLFDGFAGIIEPNTAEPVRVRSHLCRTPATAFIYEGTVNNGSEYGAVHILHKAVGADCEKMQLKKGQSLVLDFGQEIVGWPKLTVKGSYGTEVEAFFAEFLNDSGLKSRGNDGPEGSPYLNNYRAALSRYVVKLSGEDAQTYTPYFTFFGFRYIEIRATEDIEVISALGQVVGSDLTETGSFVCDNEDVNRLYSNAVWGMRGNYLSIPTDCPQRNERLGWTADTQIFTGAAAYMADIRAFLHKWLADCRNSQIPLDGAYADIVPSLTGMPNARNNAWADNVGNAAWADAGIIVPYKLYRMYNDIDIIREHYDSMEWYMRYLENNGLKGPGFMYGDWLSYVHTDNAYISVCYYACDLAIMKVFSEVMGKPDRAHYYADRREQVLGYWKETYVKDRALTVNTQTGYLLAFAFGMVPAELIEAFKGNLRKLIEGNDYTLSTGFVGTGILCQTLDKLDMADLCYSLLMQTKDPSWLYSVRQGATTIWERWNSYTLEKGFGDVDMNSFNHYAYGAVAEWFYAGMCGIQPDEKHPGFERFILKPTPDIRTYIPEGQRRINQAKATFTMKYGTIESAWAFINGGYEYNFIIPEGSQARVSVLSGDVLFFNALKMTGEELGATREGDRLVFTLGPGRYHIRTQMEGQSL